MVSANGVNRELVDCVVGYICKWLNRAGRAAAYPTSFLGHAGALPICLLPGAGWKTRQAGRRNCRVDECIRVLERMLEARFSAWLEKAVRAQKSGREAAVWQNNRGLRRNLPRCVPRGRDVHYTIPRCRSPIKFFWIPVPLAGKTSTCFAPRAYTEHKHCISFISTQSQNVYNPSSPHSRSSRP